MEVLIDNATSMSAPLPGASLSATGVAGAMGRLGILSQSGHLAAQAAGQAAALSLGPSSVIQVAADQPGRVELVTALGRLLGDPEIKGVVLILDQDGRPPEALLEMLAIMTPHKPVVAFVEGVSSDGGARTEHGGVVVSLSDRSRSRQASALKAAGAIVVERAGNFGVSLLAALDRRGKRSTSGKWPDLWQSDFASTMRLVEQEVYGPC